MNELYWNSRMTRLPCVYFRAYNAFIADGRKTIAGKNSIDELGQSDAIKSEGIRRINMLFVGWFIYVEWYVDILYLLVTNY